jgi:hypothetical protein
LQGKGARACFSPNCYDFPERGVFLGDRREPVERIALCQRVHGAAVLREVAQLGWGKAGAGWHHDASCPEDTEVSDDEIEGVAAAEYDPLLRGEPLRTEPASHSGGEAV